MLSRKLIVANFKLGLAVLAVLFIGASSSTAVFAQNKFDKPRKGHYGVIKIMTDPGRLPLIIDGQARGETQMEYQSFELDPGVHNVVVKLPNGQLWTRDIEVPVRRVKCVVVNYRPLPPPPKSPCPFPVIVSAPKGVTEGEIITYTADVAYGGDTSGLHYNWTISPSAVRIMSGAGSPTITVDSTNLGSQRLIATLTVDNGSADPSCRQTAQAVSMVEAQKIKPYGPSIFDECKNCTFDDQKARLDHLGTELQNDPSTTAYIIVYGGRTSPIRQVERLMTRARDYLTKDRGIDESRIVIVNGGFREYDSVELWIVPRGAAPPRATPTIQVGDVKPAGPVRRRRG